MAVLGRKNPNQQYEDLKHAAAQARLPFDRDAWLNLAFYLDEQYVEWDTVGSNIRRIERPKDMPDIPRPQFNKIMQYVQQLHADVLQDKPAADVLPANDDYFAPADAAVAKSYCEYVTEPVNANWDKQLSSAALWALLAPSGYLKFVWNNTLKRPDICAPSYFEVYPDPYAKEFSKCRYVIHSQFMSAEQVYETYGVRVSKSSLQSSDPTKTELIRGMGSSPVLAGVTVNELWQKPTRDRPNGLYVVWTGSETLVEPCDLPYEHLRANGGRLPFIQLGAIERPDSLMYKSPVSYLRSANMTFNKMWAQDIMIRDNHAAAKWWIPTELDLEAQPNSAPNQILRGTGSQGLEPKYVQPPAMPSGDQPSRVEEQMMHIVGQHEVSQGQVPGRVEAAKAIELLKESDEGRNKALLGTIDAGISEGWYQILMLAKQFETEKKMLMIYSVEGLPEVQRFRKERVDPGMRIKVTRMNGLGRTRAARQDALMNLWTNKVIVDPDLMATLMEVPIPSFTQPKMQDVRLARNENITLAAGEPVVPNSWDEHMIHLREHNNYRKTAEFLTADADVRQKFEHHCTTHDNLMLQQIMKQGKLMQAQALASGQVPPGGGPPPEGATPAPPEGSV